MEEYEKQKMEEAIERLESKVLWLESFVGKALVGRRVRVQRKHLWGGKISKGGDGFVERVNGGTAAVNVDNIIHERELYELEIL